MSFFDDNDPFQDVLRDFFGARHSAEGQNIISNEEEDRVIDFIEDDNYVYIIFELPGYNEKDILISVNGKELEISANKKGGENIQAYLARKLNQGMLIQKTLPRFVKTKKFSHTMKNGVLEIIFGK